MERMNIGIHTRLIESLSQLFRNFINTMSKSDNQSGSNQRKRKTQRPVEETELESNYGLPHIPISTHIEQTDLDEEDHRSQNSSQSLKGDYGNIALLMFLYILQGIPLGLAGSIPMLLTSRKVSYKDQAVFSFVFWPFSIKLLWAPLVDSLYFARFGRRKTWLVPIQYLIGVFMLVLSFHANDLVGKESSDGTVNIMGLTVIFFMLNFLAATQDIAVDGWALTMLSRYVIEICLILIGLYLWNFCC